MKIYLPSDAPPREKSALALGSFDGVHAAHLALIQSAERTEGLTAVFTFKETKAPCLTTLDERLELFEKQRVDAVFLYELDKLRNMRYTDFFNEILVEKIGISSAHCGFNFTFGQNAAGRAKDLARLCAEQNITCRVLDEMKCSGITISSSAIKEQLLYGNIELASKMLARRHEARGIVAHGKALASKLGFPTMNISYGADRAPLRRGVYFTECEIEGRTYSAVSNFGIRPTFGDITPTVETYLLDGGGDFYGKEIKVRFIAFSRDEQKFDSEYALQCAVMRDIENAKNFFGL